MSRYNSSRELAQKMDSEGGLAEFAFGYGLHADDLPADIPDDIRKRLVKFLKLSDEYDALQSWLFDQADNDPIPGDWDYEEK